MTEAVVNSLDEARRLVASGNPRLARAVLQRMIAVMGEDCPSGVIASCRALAIELEDSGLELHFALRHWLQRPGTVSGRQGVLEAALKVPEARESAYRIICQVGRVDDWITIAGADRHRSWPEVTALGSSGAHGASKIEQLVTEGWMKSVDGDDGLGWSTLAARVTRAGRSVAVGALGVASAGTWRYVPALSTWDCSAALRWSTDSSPVRLQGRVVVLATQYSFSGYWHWSMEGLLKLVRLDEAGELQPEDRILICANGRSNAYISDSLRSVGMSTPSIQVTDRFDIEVERLLVPGRHDGAGGLVEEIATTDVPARMRERARFGNEAAIRAVRHRLGLERVAPQNPARRLLISRGDANKRRVSNESALFTALERHGFEVLVPGALSFEEQVDAFSGAEIIVGPHGAGLTNLMFAPSDSAVLELHQADMDRKYYRWLANWVGMRYRALSCASDPQSPLDMVADVDATVEAALDMLA